MDSKKLRTARRIEVLLRWSLEDYGDLDADFKEVLEDGELITILDPIEDKFFYRVAFVPKIGVDSDILSEKVYKHLLENMNEEVANRLGGIAVNFLGGAYGS